MRKILFTLAAVSTKKLFYLYLHHKEEKTHYETSLSYRTRMATLSIGYSPTGHDVHNSNC